MKIFYFNIKNAPVFLPIFLFLFFGTNNLYAGTVDQNRARIVAVNWLGSEGETSITSADIEKVVTAAGTAGPLYHVVVFKPSGWVIVSGTDATEPVLGWSASSVFPSESKPVQMKGWFDALEVGMNDAIKNGIRPDIETVRKWQLFSQEGVDPSQLKSTSTSTGPLLTSTWNQDRYYNDMCPVDPEAISTGNNHVWLGCVATAMAQVMKYWEYPYSGLGSHSYVDDDYGEQSANFEAAAYIWAAMPDNVTAPNAEVAEICYHCAVSVNMDFGPSGSGAWLEDTEPAFVDYFKYNSTNYISDKDRWAAAEWEALLKRELDNGRPIVYSGYNSTQGSGHAWVCDGYSGSYFHFNWGWSGEGDGNYLLNNLTPPGKNFSYFQSAIFGIEPVHAGGLSLPYQQGFETASASPFSLFGVYEFTSEEKHTGSQSIRLGKPAINSSAESSLSLCFTVPQDAELNFWVKRVTPEESANNQQKVLIMPQYGSTPLAVVFSGDYDDDDWVNYSVDLSAYHGQDIRLLFVQEVDDYVKRQWMYIDDITLTGLYVNLAPYRPDNPVPVNGASDVSLSPKLMWAGGDPNGDDLTYEVYLDTVNPPQLIASVFDNNFTAQNLPHSTLHFWKVIASDGELTSESPVWKFTTTGIPPDMALCGIDNITATTAVICGEVLTDNGATIFSRGICWDTETNPTTNDKLAYPQFENDVYNCELTGLTPYTTYYYRAFAISNEGTGYSEQGEFATLPGLPVVSQGEVENIFRTTATVNGRIENIYDEFVSERGIVWSLTEGFDTELGNRVSENGNWTSPGNFAINVSGLPGPARIFFRVFAVNSAGTAFSDEASFEALNTPPFIDLDADNSSGSPGNGYFGLYTEQLDSGKIADVDVLLGDADNDPVQKLVITLKGQVHDAEEYLVVSGVYENIDITGNQTDSLVLIANGEVGYDEWAVVLGMVEIRNMHDSPKQWKKREVSVIAGDGFDNSAPAIATMSVIPVNDEPVCVLLPSLDTVPLAGNTVSVVPGTWEDALDECSGEMVITHQWQYRDDEGVVFDVSGETGPGLFLDETLCGTEVRVVETVTDSDCGGENIVTTHAESVWADVARNEQHVVFDPLPVHYMHEGAFRFDGYASSGLPVTYGAVNEDVVRVSNDTAYLVATGRVIVSCMQQGNDCFLPTGKTNRLAVVEKGIQQVENYSDMALNYPDSRVALQARASSGLPLTAISSDKLVVNVENDTLCLNGTGSVSVMLFQPGNINYHPSDTVFIEVTVDKGRQVITADYEEMHYGAGPYPCNVYASSGLPVSFEFSDPGKLEYSTDSFRVLSTGEVTLTATQEGNVFWCPAEPDVQSITLLKGEQTLLFEPIGEKKYNDPDFILEASTNSGMDVLFSISDTTIATVAGGLVHIKDVGSTLVTASNSGSDLWEPVSVQQTLNVLPANQVVNAGYFDTLTYGDPAFSIDYSASSKLDVAVDVADLEIAVFNGNEFEIQNAGTTSVTFSQDGNEQWEPAEPVTRELIVEQAAQTLYSELPDTVENLGQKIPAAVFASSGLPVELIANDEQLAAIDGDSIAIRSHGELWLTASQQGNRNFLPVQDQFSVIITEYVSIGELSAASVFAYPNPAKSYVVIVTREISRFPCVVKLINPIGEVVSSWTMNGPVGTFSLETLPGGVYLIMVEGTQFTLRQKLIVQK
ncbi:MAG: C10 family peptidase [Prolixibacteraceae bacterium]|nr:C10 family peptidase [Prolixibacteraceae bacterium]